MTTAPLVGGVMVMAVSRLTFEDRSSVIVDMRFGARFRNEM